MRTTLIGTGPEQVAVVHIAQCFDDVSNDWIGGEARKVLYEKTSKAYVIDTVIKRDNFKTGIVIVYIKYVEPA